MAANYSQSTNIAASILRIAEVIKDRGFSSKLNLELKSENPDANGVWFRFHHGVTFTSWGEKITITLSSVTAGVTCVKVHSECGAPTQVIDWGKNKQNVCNIIEYIERAVPQNDVASVPETQPAVRVGKKFCPNCGKQLNAVDAFCSACGTKQP